MQPIHINNLLFLEALDGLLHSFWFWLMVACIAVDIITGTAKSIKYRNWDSSLSKDGLLKHITVVITVMLVGTLTRLSGYQEAVLFSIAWSLGFTMSYTGSILENIDALGWHYLVPDFARIYFNRTREKYDEKIQEKYVTNEIETTKPGYTKEITIKTERKGNNNEIE
ncbi:phage holin family protein [Aerococcus urinaeequi]|uniref:phage holin family protein n=2 Tax=Aerococcus urinaeequi TaxID=51665 RepID=UPI003D6AA7B2